MLRPENTSGHMFLADAEINETVDRELQLFMTIALLTSLCLLVFVFLSLVLVH